MQPTLMQQQTLVWKPWLNPGVENLRLRQDDSGIHASSHLIQSVRGNSIAATYVLHFDPRWRFRRLWLKVDNLGQRTLTLERDIRGHWLLNGEPRHDLNDCQHVMLSATPFTHTAILQRSALEIGQSEEVQVVHVDMLTFTLQARSQRYQCLRQQDEHTLYRYETAGKQSRELTMDSQGFLTKASEQYLRLTSKLALELNTWV
ncbi:putative glycolipid-binding domain-containing protein [Pseudomonas turukhanskensis]|nr:putative glycolipid-binding domain-containing protein [Pseudomonas turukhanskensis]